MVYTNFVFIRRECATQIYIPIFWDKDYFQLSTIISFSNKPIRFLVRCMFLAWIKKILASSISETLRNFIFRNVVSGC